MSEIRRHVAAGHVLFRVESWEEDEAAIEVTAALREALGPALEVYEWDAAGANGPEEVARSLEDVLDAAARETVPALYLIRDAHRYLERPGIVRRLRRLRGTIGDCPVRVVLLTPQIDLPPDLAHEVPTAAHALPTYLDLVAMVEAETMGRLEDGITPRIVASALRGFTRLEARLALRRALAAGAHVNELALTRLFEEKARRVQGSTLEFFPPSVRAEDVGGLEAFKEWARRRAAAFRETAGEAVSRPLAAGAGTPRGVLLTGVSGCGKSLAVKGLSRALGAPLFRLDMARVFSRGEPESNYGRAIAAIEAMAPCILWVDEIENALALGAQDTGSAARISGSFLTWLQERPDGIFVAATANRIELLPAELLRRGRFDQIFFVDLPDEEERKGIWSIHLARTGHSPARFDLIVLSRSTAGWSGAEIAAAVDSALVDATHEGKPLGKDQLFRAIGRTVPLAVTMKEQIKRVKEWAHDRALSASM